MAKQYPIRNVTELRADFWREYESGTFGNLPKARLNTRGGYAMQNAQPCDIRMTFVDYVDGLARSESISPRLAQLATL